MDLMRTDLPLRCVESSPCAMSVSGITVQALLDISDDTVLSLNLYSVFTILATHLAVLSAVRANAGAFEAQLLPRPYLPWLYLLYFFFFEYPPLRFGILSLNNKVVP